MRLAFSADLPSARAAAARVRSFFAEQGVTGKDLFACELCVAEACNNAVEYADAAAREHQAFVDALCSATQLELRVTDHTEGFDWPKRSSAPVVKSERGRGLFIIDSFMDEVLYLRGNGENTLIMRKKRLTPPTTLSGHESTTIEESQRQLAETKHVVANMARELCFRSETLSSMFRHCKDIGGDLSAEAFAQRLLTDLLHLVSADWYVVRFVSADKQQLTVAACSDAVLDTGSLALNLGERHAASLETQVATSRTAARYAAAESVPNEPLRAAGETANGLVHALSFGGTLIGTLALGRRHGDFDIGEMHVQVVNTFSEFLAIQVSAMRHREEAVHKRIFAHELEIAHDIQRSLLPVMMPQLPGFGLAGGWQAAGDVGGDFYDALALSDDTVLLMVADVMGKGVPAALFATNLRGLMRGLSARFDEPAMLLTRLNSLLYDELSAVSMFITAQVALVDVKTRRVTAAGAGHCPLLYSPEGGEPLRALATKGMPLGVLPNTQYRSLTATLGRPGTVLLHTDGLTDARNERGEEFGQARLMAWLDTNRDLGRSATELRGRLVNELKRHRGEASATDDQAFLLLTEEVSDPPNLLEAKVPRSRAARRALAANN